MNTNKGSRASVVKASGLHPDMCGSTPQRATTKEGMRAQCIPVILDAIEKFGPLYASTVQEILRDKFEDIYTKYELQSCVQFCFDEGILGLGERMRLIKK